jgi:IPT/TIG domain
MTSEMSRSSCLRWVAALGLVAAALLPAAAAAKPVVVGSPLEGTLISGKAGKEGTYFNSALEDPDANVTSPIDGAIIALNMEGIGAGIPYRLRILSPDGGSSYTARASSKTIIPDAQGDGKFRTLLIKAGETVGIDMPAEGKLGGYETGPSSAYAFWVPPLGDGSSLPYEATKTGRELAFNVEVLPKPTISKVTPGAVDLLEKAQVKIRGNDLQHVVRISVGDRAVRTWRNVNEHLIVARTPRIKKPRETHVRVVTAAGPSAPNRASLIRFG